MGRYDSLTALLDSEDLMDLEPIEPFPVVVDALTEAVENFSYTIHHSYSDPILAFYGRGLDHNDECEFIPSSLPRIYVQLLEPSVPRFFIRIDIPRSDVDTEVSVFRETFCSSAFYNFFKSCIYECVQGYMSVFEIDVLGLSRLITYYLQLLGFPQPQCVQVNKSMDVSRGDMSLAVISDDIKVPETFRRAFAKLKDLDMQEDDCMFLRLSAHDSKTGEESMEIQVWKEDGNLFFSEQQKVGDRDDLERRRAYRNFDCISFYIHTIR